MSQCEQSQMLRFVQLELRIGRWLSDYVLCLLIEEDIMRETGLLWISDVILNSIGEVHF